MIVRNEEDFSSIAQNRTAPIYFFDQKTPPHKNKILTCNGTATLFENNSKTCGINNFHVYEHYLKNITLSTVFKLNSVSFYDTYIKSNISASF